MVNILINVLIQIVIFIVSVFVIGFIISLINRLFYRFVNHNRIVCYATGIIGTPIHELSHALFCVVFLHKINEIKLFQIDEETGVLGYVNHSYNKRNLYQSAGNFFIGVAPIVCGSIFLFILMMFLLPDVYETTQNNFKTFSLIFSQNKYSYFISAVFDLVSGVFKGIFLHSLVDWKLWVFIVICFCVALHMNLSGADIKGSLIALPIIIVIIIALNLIFGFTGLYTNFLTVVTSIGCTLIGFLLLSVVFSLVMLIIGISVYGFKKIVLKRR